MQQAQQGEGRKKRRRQHDEPVDPWKDRERVEQRQRQGNYRPDEEILELRDRIVRGCKERAAHGGDAYCGCAAFPSNRNDEGRGADDGQNGDDCREKGDAFVDMERARPGAQSEGGRCLTRPRRRGANRRGEQVAFAPGRDKLREAAGEARG